jgi:tellurium resistance protein TerD
MMIGELYLHNGAWKFNAIGNGVAKDLAGLCSLYGVQVI